MSHTLAGRAGGDARIQSRAADFGGDLGHSEISVKYIKSHKYDMYVYVCIFKLNMCCLQDFLNGYFMDHAERIRHDADNTVLAMPKEGPASAEMVIWHR